MCLFKAKVTVCGCEDWMCKQANPEIGDNDIDNLPCGGHIIKLHYYHRVGPMCMGYFINEDPGRLSVRYGMDPNNANSKMDCRNKKWVYDKNVRTFLKTLCRECLDHCDQDDGEDLDEPIDDPLVVDWADLW